MDLDRIQAAIRPRTPWEGIDLGFALAQRWFLPLWGLWWLTALPVGAATALWLHQHPNRWLLAIWWLKPLFETLPMLWLSRALFGSAPPLSGGPGAWAAAARTLVGRPQILGLLPYLLWRRLAPSRSLDLPVALLEGMRGKASRARRQVLHGTSGSGAWLTVIGLHLETFLGLGAVLSLYFLVPEEFPRLDLDAVLFDPDSSAYWVASLLTLVAMSVMGPFYLAGGFALYLTRRTQLEAWDLELIFRRAVESQARAPRGLQKAAGAAPLLVCLLALALTPVSRPASAQAPPSAEEAKAIITEILADPDFGHTRKIDGWVYVGDGAEHEAESPDWSWATTLARWGKALAEPIRWGLGLIAVIAVALLLRQVLRDLRPWSTKRKRRSGKATSSQSLGIAAVAAPLPEDVPTAVRALLGEGDNRAALALLYRAAIARLRARGLTIPPGATEGECVRLARAGRPQAEAAYLRRLVGLWQGLAYAQLAPAGTEIEDLLARWPEWDRSAEGEANGA